MSEACGSNICQENQECPPQLSIFDPFIAPENLCTSAVANYMAKPGIDPVDRLSLSIEHAISSRNSDPYDWDRIRSGLLDQVSPNSSVSSIESLFLASATPLFEARAARRQPKTDELELAYESTKDSMVIGGKILDDINITRFCHNKNTPEGRADRAQYVNAKKLMAGILVLRLSLQSRLSNGPDSNAARVVYPSSSRERGKLPVLVPSKRSFHTGYTMDFRTQKRRIFDYRVSYRNTKMPGVIDIGDLGRDASRSIGYIDEGLEAVGKIIKRVLKNDGRVDSHQRTYSEILASLIQSRITPIKERDATRR